MSTNFYLLDTFLKSATAIERSHGAKLLRTLLRFYQNSSHPGLNYEKLQGKSGMHSIRVDQAYRVILDGVPKSATFHFVGTHDDAYRFADKASSTIPARIGHPRPA